MRVEVAREASTLVLLACLAWLVGSRIKTRLAAFFLVFGAWDITFYFWLRALIGWPASLMTWDLLFLIPVPWSAPVLAPVIVAGSIAAFGAITLWRDPRRSRIGSVVLLLAGFGVTYVAFVWNSGRLLAGKVPEQFPWIVFSVGVALLLASSGLTLSNRQN